MENWKKNVYVQWVNKLSKLDEKMRGKTEDSINKKLLKLNKKIRRKTDHLFVRVEIICKKWKTSKI